VSEPVIDAVPAGERRVAAFDFDGTIARRDTVVPFLASVAGRTSVARAVAARSAAMARIAAGRAGGGARDEEKARLIERLLGGRTATEVEAAGSRYASALWARQSFRPEILERLAWHRSRGHEIVIVSASLDVYLRPLAPRLGVGHVISCTLVADDAGRLTGELAGGNVRGPEKVRRLTAWLGGEEALAATELWAYGDSSGDDELLAAADHPTRV
jgi:phosphatidylglycerophosphatase C